MKLLAGFRRHFPFYLMVLGAVLGIAYFNSNKPTYYPPAPLPVSRPVHVDGYYRSDGTYVSPYDRAPPGEKAAYDRIDSARMDAWMRRFDVVIQQEKRVRLQAWLVFLGFAGTGACILRRRHRLGRLSATQARATEGEYLNAEEAAGREHEAARQMPQAYITCQAELREHMEARATEQVEAIQCVAQSCDAEGSFQMGRAYFYGTGVLQNYAEAAKWFRKAAERGHAKAQHNIGLVLWAVSSVTYSTVKPPRRMCSAVVVSRPVSVDRHA